MKRRFFLFAAPAIVAAPSLMRLSAKAIWMPEDGLPSADEVIRNIQDKWAERQMQTIQVLDAHRRGIRTLDYYKMIHGELPSWR